MLLQYFPLLYGKLIRHCKHTFMCNCIHKYILHIDPVPYVEIPNFITQDHFYETNCDIRLLDVGIGMKQQQQQQKIVGKNTKPKTCGV